MKLADKLTVLHAEILQGRHEEAARHLCDLLELCRLNVRYPDGQKDVRFVKLESFVKQYARKEPQTPEVY
jgi:hypothetical protein